MCGASVAPVQVKLPLCLQITISSHGGVKAVFITDSDKRINLTRVITHLYHAGL